MNSKNILLIFIALFLTVNTGCLQFNTKTDAKKEVKIIDKPHGNGPDIDVKKKFKQWKKKLYSDDETIQTAAAVSLLSLEYTDSLNLLKDILKEGKNNNITISVLKAFGFTNDDRALIQIITLLDSEYKELRSAATASLGKLKTSKAQKLMIFNLLNKQNTLESRTMLAEALGNVLDRDSVAPLITTLKSDDENLQTTSHIALVQITKQSFDKDVEKWQTWWEQNKVKSREEWLEEIVEELSDTLKQVETENEYLNKEIAKKSIEILKSNANSGKIKIFLDAAKSKYTEVRVFAANELAKQKPPESVEIFSELLVDNNLAVKVVAARTLGEIADKKTLPLLLEVINNENPDFQVEVAKALGRIGMNQAVEPLITLLDNKSIKVVKSAIEALAQIDDKQVVSNLIPFIQHNDPTIREATAIALGKIKDGKSVDPLIGALLDSEERVRWYAADSLGKLESIKALDPLLNLLSDNNARVRESATASLGKIGDKKAVEPLTKMLDDADERVVEEASDALLAIAGGELKALDNLSDIFFLKKDYNRATKILEKQLAKFSENEESLWNSRIRLAKSFFLTGNWDKAAGLYTKLVEHFPENGDFKKDLLLSMSELKQFDLSLDLLADWGGTSQIDNGFLWQNRLDIILLVFKNGDHEKVKELVDKFETENPELGGEILKPEFLSLREKSITKMKENNLSNNWYNETYRYIAS